MNAVENFHCQGCGAQAGIASQYSDDPDERAAEFDADLQFLEDWNRDHANCGNAVTTTAAQRNADEALGRVSRQLTEHAERLNLAISKRRLFGEWTVEAIPMSTLLRLKPTTGATELEALDKMLDQLNRVEEAVA